ncbi:MAG: hypothetical protein ABEH81_01505 [Halopenitus sp.]
MIQERKQDIVSALQELAKWPHCNHGSVNSFDGAIIRLAKQVSIPPQIVTVNYKNELTISEYKWQMATQEWADHMFEDESFLRERRDSLKHRLSEGIGKPSATDGSKGQWRAGLKGRIFALDWLLGHLPGGVEVCIECGERQYPRECNHEQTEVVDPDDYFRAIEDGGEPTEVAKELML